jgi:tellurite resistance protein TehA-like permease
MGTGSVAVLLHQLPYQFPGLDIISDIFFILDVVIFVILTVASIARYTLWPNLFWATWKNPVHSSYW